jgi:hypothetical protein
MKPLLISIAIMFMFCVNSFTQTTEKTEKLDQIALLKQFNGNWEGVVGVDSICRFTLQINDRGGEGSYVYSAKGKVYEEGKQLWGYDRKADKIIVTQLINYEWIGIWKLKFISPKVAKCSFYQVGNMKNSSDDWLMELVSKDELKESQISSGKVFNYKRVK